jgi:ComF family protein
MSSILNNLKEHLLNIVYPEGISCLGCGRDIELDLEYRYGLCSDCISEINWISGKTCKACGGPISELSESQMCHSCETRFSYLVNCEACFLYEGLGKDLIMELKYNRKTYLGKTLGKMLADVAGASYCETFDLVVSVPLHKRRYAERGFNQMDLIGEVTAEVLEVEYRSDALQRQTNTPRLKGLNRHERKDIMEGLFLADKQIVLGKRILLIDDIYTTGATMNACAKVLLEAGALNVYGSVLSVNFRD